MFLRVVQIPHRELSLHRWGSASPPPTQDRMLWQMWALFRGILVPKEAFRTNTQGLGAGCASRTLARLDTACEPPGTGQQPMVCERQCFCAGYTRLSDAEFLCHALERVVWRVASRKVQISDHLTRRLATISSKEDGGR